MGGVGSGRGQQYGKRTTDGMLRLDIGQLQRAGRLWAGDTFSWKWTWGLVEPSSSTISIHVETDRVVLSYQNQSGLDEKWHPMEYPVYLDWTTPHYGGRRPWFLCPASGCGQRVAVLYGGRFFACRQCQGLVYKSQREPAARGAYRRIDALRARLKWKPGFVYGPEPKAKGMHWRTFILLQERCLAELELVGRDVERVTARTYAIRAKYGIG